MRYSTLLKLCSLTTVLANPVPEVVTDVETLTSVLTSCDSSTYTTETFTAPTSTVTVEETLSASTTSALSSPSSSASECTVNNEYGLYKSPNAIKPKVFIISMFDYEAETTWYDNMDFVHNITVPGLSPLFPWVHCVSNYSVCQFITGEGEINAGPSVMALALSPLFDLSESYFLIAGIAGGEPSLVTLGSVTFAEYAVQVALEYEIDSREVLPKYNWTTGYFPYDTTSPLAYPEEWYGSEIFRVNGKLMDRAFELASGVELANGSDENVAFRALYDYAPANEAPSVVKCDVVTSDTYWSGDVLSFYFANLTSIMTNGTATYCSTAQEDNATLESMMRAALFGLVDFSRIVVMRTISDFARAPPVYEDDAVNFFNNVSQGGSSVAVENIYKAGLPFVMDVLENWDDVYSLGAYSTEEYLGDVFGTLGGEPNFGPGAITEPEA